MKVCFSFFITLLLLAACNNTSVQQPEIDTHSSSDVSQSERQIQIENARNNRALLPGRWQVIDARKEDDELTKLDLKDMNFDKVLFSLPDSFHAYHQKKEFDHGTYEWMAEDRELVLTSADRTVQRMLIKKMNHQYLKLKFNSTFLTFKKVD